MGNKKDVWICLDLGRTYMDAAILHDGKPLVVGSKTCGRIPACAYVTSIETDRFECITGAKAVPFRHSNPERFLPSIKDGLGKPLPFEDNVSYDFSDVLSAMFKEVISVAAQSLRGSVPNAALLTVPTSYTDSDKRKETMIKAATKAGLSKVEFITEPEAIAQHYAVISNQSPDLVMVFDLGSRALNATLLDCSKPVGSRLLMSESKLGLGGEYINKAIYEHIRKQNEATGHPLRVGCMLDDYETCSKMKETLSTESTASAYLSGDVHVSLTATTFNTLLEPTVDKALNVCSSLIQNASIMWADVKCVLLAGGSAQLPAVGNAFKQRLDSPDKMVTVGCGEYDPIFAACLGGIATKMPPLPEPVAILTDGTTMMQLRAGDNSFGRSSDCDFTIASDKYMSRLQFKIKVSKNSEGKWDYTVYTLSHGTATIINGLNALILDNPFANQSARIVIGDEIAAGHSHFKLVSPAIIEGMKTNYL